MFCGSTCQMRMKHPDRNSCHEVKTLCFKGQVLKCQAKIRACSNFVTAEPR